MEERAKRKTKKDDAGPTYLARGQDQLQGAKESGKEPVQMVSLLVESALGQSMLVKVNSK